MLSRFPSHQSPGSLAASLPATPVAFILLSLLLPRGGAGIIEILRQPSLPIRYGDSICSGRSQRLPIFRGCTGRSRGIATFENLW